MSLLSKSKYNVVYMIPLQKDNFQQNLIPTLGYKDVFPVNIIPYLCFQHCLPHGRSWFCHRITAQINYFQLLTPCHISPYWLSFGRQSITRFSVTIKSTRRSQEATGTADKICTSNVTATNGTPWRKCAKNRS